MMTGSSLAFSSVRAIASGAVSFKEGETGYPVVELLEDKARGFVSLTPLLPEEVADAYTAEMWRQAASANPLVADVLDILSNLTLINDGQPFRLDIDEVLMMRKLMRRRGGEGRRGGYSAAQREDVRQALHFIRNFDIDVTVDLSRNGSSAKGKPRTITYQGRPFGIAFVTERGGEEEGASYVIVTPGPGAALGLTGPLGLQYCYMSIRTIELDPYRRAPEKALARYLSRMWRIRAEGRTYADPFLVRTLLKEAGLSLDARDPVRTRERLEKALDCLQAERIIAGWRYLAWDKDEAYARHGWANERTGWPTERIVIDPASEIALQYERLEKPREKPKVIAAKPNLPDRLRAHRQALGLAQMRAALELGIPQQTYSRAERGLGISPRNRELLEAWIAGEALPERE